MKCLLTRVVFVALMMPAIALADGHSSKTVQQLQPGHYATNCFYFTLEGVPVADAAAKPGDP